ncbi:CHRD domain-containing protein [Saccharopolyspora rosea]|uniref:CHRD domain-containing protein n=1 Tax=Saccharopolyspora rosea TaxID=524884 RepID=A0ABW3FUR1_9PSEU
MPTGTATLTWAPDTRLITAAVDMKGFTPSHTHAMHLYPGSCADQGKPASVSFPDISADAGGSVRNTVTDTTPQPGIPVGSHLTVYLGSSAQLGAPRSLGNTSIACADIPGTAPSHGAVQLMLRPAGNPVGRASLTYNPGDRTLRVDVQAYGLSPNRGHAMHIHAGSCVAQGDVVYPLPDLRTDRGGRASETTILHNVSSAPPARGWYLNVHMGAANEIQLDSTPTLLYAPILCGDIP